MKQWLRRIAGAGLMAYAAAVLACGTETDATGLVQQAERLFSAGDLTAAESTLEQAIASFPDSADAYRLLGEVTAADGDSAKAVASFSRAIAHDPNDQRALRQRGIAYLELEDARRALADFDRVIQLNPDNLEAYVLRGQARARVGLFLAAISDADRVVERAATSEMRARGIWLRGVVRTRSGDLRGGVNDFTRFLELVPNDHKAYEARGRTLASDGRLDDALLDLRKALAVRPDDAGPLLLIAQILLEQDRIEEARDMIEQATHRLPDQPELRLLRADFAYRTGDEVQALAEIDAALALGGLETSLIEQAQDLLDQLRGR